MPRCDPAPPLAQDNNYTDQLLLFHDSVLERTCIKLNVYTKCRLSLVCIFISFSLTDKHVRFSVLIWQTLSIGTLKIRITCTTWSLCCEMLSLLLLLLHTPKVPDTALPLCCYTTDRLGHYMPNVSDITHTDTQGCTGAGAVIWKRHLWYSRTRTCRTWEAESGRVR